MIALLVGVVVGIIIGIMWACCNIDTLKEIIEVINNGR